MTYSGQDLRLDYAMRDYVAKIIEYLSQGGDHANARMNMIENGVPAPVQARVLEGKAVSH